MLPLVLLSNKSRHSAVNESITGTYTVAIASVNPTPDVELVNVNGVIDTTLYFQGGLPRPIGINALNTNNKICVAVPDKQHAQTYSIDVYNTNGRSREWSKEITLNDVSVSQAKSSLLCLKNSKVLLRFPLWQEDWF